MPEDVQDERPDPSPDSPVAAFVRPCGRVVLLVGGVVSVWRDFIPSSRVFLTLNGPKQRDENLIERPGIRMRFWYRHPDEWQAGKADRDPAGFLRPQNSGYVALADSAPMNAMISKYVLPLICFQGWADLFVVQDADLFDCEHYIASIIDSPWNRVMQSAHRGAVEEQKKADRMQSRIGGGGEGT